MSSKLKLPTINFFQALSGLPVLQNLNITMRQVIMLIDGFTLTGLCKVYFLQLPKRKQLEIMYNASVSSKCYHPPDDPGAFDQTLCLGQGAGILTKAGHFT